MSILSAKATEQSSQGKQRHCEIYRGLHKVVRNQKERFIGKFIAVKSRLKRFMNTFSRGVRDPDV